jgi:hypothetical protein
MLLGSRSRLLPVRSLVLAVIGLGSLTAMAAPSLPGPIQPPQKLPDPPKIGPVVPSPAPTPADSPPASEPVYRRPMVVTGLRRADRSPVSVAHNTSQVGYGLAGFLLRHPKGTDHKSRHIAVMPRGTSLGLALGDDDGNDPFEYRIAHSHVHVRRQPLEVRRNDCRPRNCELTYPTQPDTVFVLAGFELRRRHGDDNIREIGIMPVSPGRIRVTYEDDQRPGRDYSVRILYHLLPRSGVYGEHEIAGRNTRSRGKNVGYWDYLGERVPADAILRMPRPVHELDYRVGLPGGTFERQARATAVLQGFTIRFHNSDHHIGAFGIELGHADTEEVVVWFNDRDYDDEYDARVRIVLVDPEY